MTKEEVDRLISELEDQLKALDSKRKEILEKLANLQHQRKASAVAENAPGQKTHESISAKSPISLKIELFHSLFRGREDLYAQRWESAKTGKSGYQPVCKNDWIRGLCRKPEIKCGECVAREFVPITASVIHHHLFGFDRGRKAFADSDYGTTGTSGNVRGAFQPFLRNIVIFKGGMGRKNIDKAARC